MYVVFRKFDLRYVHIKVFRYITIAFIGAFIVMSRSINTALTILHNAAQQMRWTTLKATPLATEGSF